MRYGEVSESCRRLFHLPRADNTEPGTEVA